MLKIVHIDTGMNLRGGQQQLLILARGLRASDHEQLVVCPQGSAIAARAAREGFAVLSLQSYDPAHAHELLQLRRRLQAGQFDILHAHDGRGHTLAWLATLGLAIRRVATRRVTFLPSRLATRLFRYDLTCHAIIAVSQSIRRSLADAGVPASKIEVIPDGIELPEHPSSSETRSSVRAQWGFGEKEFLVGHVGAFTAEKGQDVALQAIALVPGKLPQARLLLAGEGPLRSSPDLAARVAQAQGRVRLLGHVENLSEFFAGLDLFVMPSRAEGLGSSALLAMAHGLAVVASRVGGLPEIVQEGETGWLVPAGSPSALADGLVVAASDRARLARMGANARERARQFSSDIMVERTEALYGRLFAG